MVQVVNETWKDACRVLAIDGPHTPKLLSRPEKLAAARRLRDQAGWPYWAIGEAFEVSESRAWRWLNGDEQTHHQVAGRGPRTGARRRCLAASQPPVVVDRCPPDESEAEPWPDNEPEPGGPWFDDDDDDEDFEQPAPRPEPRPRAKPKKPQRFGAIWTPMIEAAAARRGLDPLGRSTGAQQVTTAPQEPATPVAAAPGPIPPPPALRPPVVAPQPPPAAAPGTIALELECGHVERNLPLDGPWRQRGWVACTRCNLTHRSIRRQVW